MNKCDICGVECYDGVVLQCDCYDETPQEIAERIEKDMGTLVEMLGEKYSNVHGIWFHATNSGWKDWTFWTPDQHSVTLNDINMFYKPKYKKHWGTL